MQIKIYSSMFGVGIHGKLISDSPPLYCRVTTVYSVQEPHFLSVSLFQHLKAVQIFFKFVVGIFQGVQFHRFHD